MSTIIQNKLVLYYFYKNIKLIFLLLIECPFITMRLIKMVSPKCSLYVSKGNHNQSNSTLEVTILLIGFSDHYYPR